MKIAMTLVVVSLALVVVGCGGPGGLLIRPVPADQHLEETVICQDRGLFVYDKIAEIAVDGMIIDQKSEGLFGNGDNPTAKFVEEMDTAQGDPDVKAVVLRINSPGGTVAASEIMYRRLQRFNRCGKPVYVSINGLGASGAYYLACGAKKIYVLPSSIVGSIGVIMQTVNLAGTMDKLGITADAIVSGKNKDMASPLRAMRPEERQLLQNMVTEFYERFLTVVADGRTGRKGLDKDKIRPLADGRVYTGTQAVELGLADAIGDTQDAVVELKRDAGLTRVKVVRYIRPLGYAANVYSSGQTPAPSQQINVFNVQVAGLSMLTRPTFLYLYADELNTDGRGWKLWP
jgi:protease-4